MVRSIQSLRNNRFLSFVSDLLSSSVSNETELPKSVINARRLYQSCVNEDNLTDDDMDSFLSSIREQFFDWLTNPNITFDEYNFHLTELLLKFNEYNSFFFYQIKTTIDFDNIETLKYRIRVELSFLIDVCIEKQSILDHTRSYSA